MILLREMFNDVNVLTEGTDGAKKSYYIEGIFLQGNIKNRNGRMYPMPVLEREVNKYNENFVAQKRAFGELGHPDNPTINLDRISHVITKLQREGDNFCGRAKILGTPNGKIVETLLGEGLKIGVSSRGLGSLKATNEGINIVQDDFVLCVGGDIVADPSAPDAFVQGIMENKEWVLVEGQGWVPQFIDQTKNQIKTMSAKEVEAKKFQMFEQWLHKAGGLDK